MFVCVNSQTCDDGILHKVGNQEEEIKSHLTWVNTKSLHLIHE